MSAIVKTLDELVEKAEPHVAKLFEYGKLGYRFIYDTVEFIKIGLGIFFLLFGGSFALIIAAIEIFRILGKKTLRENWVVLWEHFDKNIHERTDGKGSQSFSGKFDRFLHAIDPELVSKAIRQLAISLLAVVAVLGSVPAQIFVLGAALGEMVARPLEQQRNKILHDNIPVAHHRWTPVVIDLVTKAAGIVVAFMFSPYILIFNICFQAAIWIVESAIALNWVPDQHAKIVEFAIYPLALFGIFKQLTYGWSLPVILWLPLMPVVFGEWLVSFFSGSAMGVLAIQVTEVVA